MHIVANAIAGTSQHRRHLRTIVVLAAIFALLWIYAQRIENPTRWDTTLLDWVQGQRHTAIDQVMLAITMSADLQMSLALMALAGVTLLIRQQWWLCVYAVCLFFSTSLSVTIVKVLVQRGRPSLLESAVHQMSFPSAHVARAVIVLGIVALIVGQGQSARRRKSLLLAAILLSSLVAVSRVYLGAHWPSDVLAGTVLAAIFLVGFHWQLHYLDEPSGTPAGKTVAGITLLTTAVLSFVMYWWLYVEQQGQLYGLDIL